MSENKREPRVVICTTCVGNGVSMTFSFCLKVQFGSWLDLGVHLPGGRGLDHQLIGPWVSCLLWPRLYP